jgi:hypothetical protein
LFWAGFLLSPGLFWSLSCVIELGGFLLLGWFFLGALQPIKLVHTTMIANTKTVREPILRILFKIGFYSLSYVDTLI